MNEEEKKLVSQIKDVAQYKTIIRYGDGHDTIAWIPRPEQTMVLNNYTAKILYDLIEKQQKEIKELKLITNTYDSYEGKDMDHTKIIIADSNYFVNGTFIEKYISKDIIRKIIENSSYPDFAIQKIEELV